MSHRLVVAAVVGVWVLGARAEAAPRSFTVEELLATRRIDDPQVSPDGKTVAFTVRQKSLAENRDVRDVWLVPLAGEGGARPFTRDGHTDHARWSPDGRHLLVVSDRGGGEPQLYQYDLAGGDARRLTNVVGGAGDGIFSPDGRLVAFTSEVNPACSGTEDEVEACTKHKTEERNKSKLRAHITSRLLFRHWNEWRDAKRSHVFVLTLKDGSVRDLTPDDSDWPTWRLGGGGDIAFSPDGAQLYVSHKAAEGEAYGTNADLYVLPTGGGEARNLTAQSKGDDASPRVSPDGKWIAFRSQARNGYESDVGRLVLMNRASGAVTRLAPGEDDLGEAQWLPDSSGLVAPVARQGRDFLLSISLDGRTKAFAPGPAGHDFALTPSGAAVVVQSGMNRPPELFLVPAGGQARQLTTLNAEQYAGLDLGPAAEEQWVEARDGVKVHSFVLKPPGLRKGQRAPLLVLIHGGPQGAWGESWGMRWNPAVFAARGYIVLQVNPRGSTGYGAAFKEGVSKDWGGLPYDDILRSVDAAEQRADVQPGHTCAAGASYGGYMVDWIAGHTDRFKCLVTHDGVFDLVSMYGATEELWFPEWELGGTYWDNPEAYRKWSPSSYVKNFKTPTLVIQGELDYRVPIDQGLGMFTALQRRGIESKLLDFPDEGHWVNKPRNSQLWYTTVLDWIDAHAKPAQGATAK